jgi:cytochrome c553
MDLRWKHIAIALAALPFAVLLFAWIGFFNVGASSGHWKITDWFLHFAMRSAVRTYALAVEVPERLPVEGIQPAAGHFARGCAICHGAPGEPRSPAALNMLPQPPDLASVVAEWSDAELFRIVKHGVRFTGMPAWPSQARDDEVWAMVAFLRTLPTLDSAGYRELAYGGNTPPPQHAASISEALAECSRCHGADGMGFSPLTPRLAGQGEAYLRESLRAYAERRRPSGMMELPVQAVDPALLAELARHFAGLPAGEAAQAGASDPALAARGEAIARNGIPTRKVPACLGCHGEGDRNPLYPHIRGQPAAYIETQLHAFRAGRRGGTEFSHLMDIAAANLDDPDIAALAAYFSNLRRPIETLGR